MPQSPSLMSFYFNEIMHFLYSKCVLFSFTFLCKYTLTQTHLSLLGILKLNFSPIFHYTKNKWHNFDRKAMLCFKLECKKALAVHVVLHNLVDIQTRSTQIYL
jgi:hypothetical protein